MGYLLASGHHLPHLSRIFPTISLFLRDPSILGSLAKNSSRARSSALLIAVSCSAVSFTSFFWSASEILPNLSAIYWMVLTT